MRRLISADVSKFVLGVPLHAFSLYGNNLTNKKYRAVYQGPMLGDFGIQAQPVTYGIRMGYKF
jgi:hypothetical protein